MRRVKLLTVMAGPTGSHQPGEHDFPTEVARDLVAGGYAEPIGWTAAPLASSVGTPPESPALEEQPAAEEHAPEPPKKARRQP